MTINEWSDATAMAEAVQNKTVSPRELAGYHSLKQRGPILNRCYRQSTLREKA